LLIDMILALGLTTLSNS